MVPKGAKVREAKAKKREDRKDRSICVKIKNKIEKPIIEKILKEITGVERIFFPRQKIPRFFFILCHTEQKKKDVWKLIRKLNDPVIGPLFPKAIISKPPLQYNKEAAISKKTTIDPLTLVLEAIPKQLTTSEIQKEFPKCDEAKRFNDRRCYLYFKALPDAFEAFEKLRNEAVCGFKISVRYRKVKKCIKKMKKSKVVDKQSGTNDESDIEKQITSDDEN